MVCSSNTSPSQVEVQHVLLASKSKLVKLNHNLIYQRFVFVASNFVNRFVAGAYPFGAYGISIKSIDNHRCPNERYTSFVAVLTQSGHWQRGKHAIESQWESGLEESFVSVNTQQSTVALARVSGQHHSVSWCHSGVRVSFSGSKTGSVSVVRNEYHLREGSPIEPG